MTQDKKQDQKQDNWIKNHVDTVVIIGAICGSLIWMNGKFNDVEKDMGLLKTDMAVIKTVLVMKNILPPELAKASDKEGKK